MFCTPDKWDSCQEEKRGCEGCYYNKKPEEPKEEQKKKRSLVNGESDFNNERGVMS